MVTYITHFFSLFWKIVMPKLHGEKKTFTILLYFSDLFQPKYVYITQTLQPFQQTFYPSCNNNNNVIEHSLEYFIKNKSTNKEMNE